MATVTPASIAYTPVGGTEQILDFDLVISEDHQTKAQITKFPVQEGFLISNHSIRQNRVVSLSGVITNVKLGVENRYPRDISSINSTVQVKEVVDELIHQGIRCRVTTNLGDYYPVIFNAFKTSQKAGLVDSMHFTLSGEEIVLAKDARNDIRTYEPYKYGAPVAVVWTEVKGADKKVLRESLADTYVYTKDDDVIFRAKVDFAKGFFIDSKDASGQTVRTTHEAVGTNTITGAPINNVHFSKEAVAVTQSPSGVSSGTPEEVLSSADKKGGITQVSGCLLNETTDILTTVAEDVVDTALGDLDRSARGVLYEAVELAGGQDSVGGMLLSAGVGCVVRTATGNTDAGTFSPTESLPSAAEIVEGASSGFGLFAQPVKEDELVKIVSAASSSITPDIDTSSFPLNFV